MCHWFQVYYEISIWLSGSFFKCVHKLIRVLMMHLSAKDNYRLLSNWVIKQYQIMKIVSLCRVLAKI